MIEYQDSTTGAISIVWATKTLSDGTVLSAVPAEVLTGVGREFVQGSSLQSEFNARMNLRWFPDLSLKMRILWENKIYQITSIETDVTARREYRLKVMALVESDPLVEIELNWNTTDLYYDQ
jgi:head-tail adaptor